jgi:hypothetical protein
MTMMALAVTWIAGTTVSAHRLDEYLQAARVDIDPHRADVELAMTPGVAVANVVIAGIDRDLDGSISSHEEQAYAANVLSAIDFEVDGQRLQLESLGVSFPDLGAMRRGEGTILLHSGAVMPSQSAGAHRVLFRNRHRPDVSVYLANAVVSTDDRLAITTLRRDRDQRELTVNYVIQPWPIGTAAVWLLAGIAATAWTWKLLTQRSRSGLSLWPTWLTSPGGNSPPS